jgi:hypothetical protein
MQPKRRGRPPKPVASPPEPPRLRVKAGALQQAVRHPAGWQWVPVPAVGADALDWEDAPCPASAC